MLRRVLMPDEGRQVRQNRDVSCNDAPRRPCRRMGFHVARIQRGRDETVFGPAPRRKIAGRAARFQQQRDIGLSPTRHLHQFVPGFRALADIPAVRLRQEPHRRLRRDPGRTHSNASGQDPSRVIHTRSSMPYPLFHATPMHRTGLQFKRGRYTFRRGAAGGLHATQHERTLARRPHSQKEAVELRPLRPTRPLPPPPSDSPGAMGRVVAQSVVTFSARPPLHWARWAQWAQFCERSRATRISLCVGCHRFSSGG